MRRFFLALIVFIVTAVSAFASALPAPVAALPQYRHGSIVYQNLWTVNLRTWREANLVDLETGRVIGRYSRGATEQYSKRAYVNGKFYYVRHDRLAEGKWYGVLINSVFRVEGNRGHAFGQLLPLRNGMPLSQQYASPGRCVPSRVWHYGLKPEMVKRLQQAQLHSGRQIPFSESFRTNADQWCLWNNRGSNSYPVAYPGTSEHESGYAVDIHRAYLSQWVGVLHQFGICRPIPDSDPIHFEMREASGYTGECR